MTPFRGAFVAIVTPFIDGKIDEQGLINLIEFQIENGTHGIVPCGTTGESATLSKDEKLAVLDFVIETNQKRVPVVFGMGGNNTQEIINTIKSSSFEGIDAILSVCPYYNKPQQKGIYYHYKTIASISPVPVILYNVPDNKKVFRE